MKLVIVLARMDQIARGIMAGRGINVEDSVSQGLGWGQSPQLVYASEEKEGIHIDISTGVHCDTAGCFRHYMYTGRFVLFLLTA